MRWSNLPIVRVVPERYVSLTTIGLALALSLDLCGCGHPVPPASSSLIPPTVPAPPAPTARAIAFQAAHLLVPYRDPLGTYKLQRPQTWGALDARSTPRFAAALGDGVRFFEPIVATDPDAGSSGKLWIDVLPIRPGSSPRDVLIQPFIDEDYPPQVLRRLTLAPDHLGGVAGYRLVTLTRGAQVSQSGASQVSLLLVPWRGHYYRVTIFGATIPPEVALALDRWRFL